MKLFRVGLQFQVRLVKTIQDWFEVYLGLVQDLSGVGLGAI